MKDPRKYYIHYLRRNRLVYDSKLEQSFEELHPFGCIVISNTGGIGWSLCRENVDQFSKSEARKRAMSRLRDKAPLPEQPHWYTGTEETLATLIQNEIKVAKEIAQEHFTSLMINS